MNPAAERFSVAALGPVSVSFAGASTQRPLSRSKIALLAALVAAGPDGIRADDLAESVWPDRRQGAAALRMAVARLRDHLRPGLLPEASDGRYQLDADVGEIDVWLLFEQAFGELAAELSPWDLRHLLSPQEAYEGVPASGLIEASRARVLQAQRVLLDRLVDERPEVLGGGLHDHLRDHLDLDPFNENILRLVATIEARRGDRRAALQTLSDARGRYHDRGLQLSQRTNELEQALLAGSPEPAGPPRVHAPSALNDLADLRRTPRVGSSEDLDRLVRLLTERGTIRVVVTGPSGVGKTRLCAELAGEMEAQGMAVLYAAATPSGDAALGPLLAAMPELRERAALLFDRDLEPDARKAELWLAVAEAIEHRSLGGPIAVMIDDCQWLDSQTVELVEFIARTQFECTVLLVLVGRDDHGRVQSSWPTTLATVRRLGVADEIDVEPLELGAVRELLARDHPDLRADMVRRVAQELHAASAGLPAVLSAVLSTMDDELLLLPSLRSLSPDRLLDGLVAGLPDHARTVGAVGALVGPDFDLDAARQITGLCEEETLAALDALVRSELVHELSADHFRVAHVLIQAALLRGSLAGQQVVWHQRAASYFSHDVHRRARHEVGALAGGVGRSAVSTLVHSATAHLDEGLYREAVADLRQADELSPGGLEPIVAGRLARALDLSGMEPAARVVRREAFDRAIAAQDHAAALAVATSGLPEAEPIDGDLELVAHLQAIDGPRLDRRRRHDRDCHLARQLAIVGAVEPAIDIADRSHTNAVTPAQIVRSVLTTRFAVAGSASPARRLAELARATPVIDEVTTEARSEYHTVLALDRYEAGDIAGAQAARDQLTTLGTAVSPLRQWHGLLFDAMIQTDAGRRSQAQKSRDVAFEYGMRFGINEAQHARFAPEFVDLWLDGQVGSMAPLLEEATFPAAESVLGRAGAAAVLHAAGEHDRALALAERLARDLFEWPRSQGTASLAVVAEILRHSADASLVTAARRAFDVRGRSMIVVGAGVVCLGPVARYRALLAADDHERRGYLASAVELADEVGLERWQTVTRRDTTEHAGEGP